MVYKRPPECSVRDRGVKCRKKAQHKFENNLNFCDPHMDRYTDVVMQKALGHGWREVLAFAVKEVSG
jgi:hypothetical protein